MRTTALIGVDAGTQGTKAAVFDVTGALLAQAFCPTTLLHPSPEATEQDPEQLFSSVTTSIREALDKLPHPVCVAGIGVDAQMAGVLGIGKDGRAVTPYDFWLDTRCAPQIDWMKRTQPQLVVERAGGQITVAHGPKMLWWKQEHPEVYDRIAAFLPLSAYLSLRLCGLSADHANYDDTHLYFSGFANNNERRWDAGLTTAFGLDGQKLPPIVHPAEKLGGLCAEAAAACCLPE